MASGNPWPIHDPRWAEFDAREQRRAREIRPTRHIVIEDDPPALSDGRWLIYGIFAAIAWLAVLWWMGAL